jgi:hypothetical protein
MRDTTRPTRRVGGGEKQKERRDVEEGRDTEEEGRRHGGEDDVEEDDNTEAQEEEGGGNSEQEGEMTQHPNTPTTLLGGNADHDDKQRLETPQRGVIPSSRAGWLCSCLFIFIL